MAPVGPPSAAICAVVTRTVPIGVPVGPTCTASIISVPDKPIAAVSCGMVVLLMACD
jgi:hypothetical protein